MSNYVAEAERGVNARTLERYIESFTTSLSERGYCAPVVGQKRAMVACFARWMGRRRIAAYEIDEATVSAFLAHLSRRGSLIGNRRCTLMAFLIARQSTWQGRVNHDGRGSRGSRSMLQLIVAGKLLLVALLIS